MGLNEFKYDVSQDAMGTHLDWQHKNISAEMIDWFWSNMEKCFLLWHPEEHQPLIWKIPPKHGNLIGAVHIAPQTWSDGTFQNLYIRFENFDDVPEEIKKYVEYEHCIIVAGLGFGEESLMIQEPMGYRIHQWQNDFGFAVSDARSKPHSESIKPKSHPDSYRYRNSKTGVIGKSNAFGWKKTESKEQGMVWAKHASVEIGNWGVFLPQIYSLYQVVKNTAYNPFSDLSVERKKGILQYKT